MFLFADGGNAESKLQMTAKMNFWATACPEHENILLFVGAVPSGKFNYILFDINIRHVIIRPT